MIRTFRSIKCSDEDMDVYEGWLSDRGYFYLRNIGFVKLSDIIGLQTYLGEHYVGRTLLVIPERVWYDKYGIPTYRFVRYNDKPSKTSAYNKYKYSHLNG